MINEIIFLFLVLIIVLLSFLSLMFGEKYLIALLVLEGVLANLFMLKEISLFGLSVCAADAFIVGIVLILNLLEEYFGKHLAESAIKIYSFSLISFFLFSATHLLFLSTAEGSNISRCFQAILSTTPRVIFATLIVSYCSLNLDRKLYAFFSRLIVKQNFSLKNFLAGSISQLFDTVLFSFFICDLFSNIWHVMFFSYLVKMVTMILMSPLLILFNYFYSFLKNK